MPDVVKRQEGRWGWCGMIAKKRVRDDIRAIMETSPPGLGPRVPWLRTQGFTPGETEPLQSLSRAVTSFDVLIQGPTPTAALKIDCTKRVEQNLWRLVQKPGEMGTCPVVAVVMLGSDRI